MKFSILIFMLFIHTSLWAQGMSTSCISKDKNVAPPESERTIIVNGTSVDTPAWADWKQANPNYEISKNWGCCEYLVKDAAGFCRDKSLVDPAIVTCDPAQGHGVCGNGKGCLAFDQDLMFQDGTDDEEDMFENQIAQFSDIQPNNSMCFVDAQCESYKCENMRCQKNFICRFANSEDSPTPDSVKCVEGYKKNNEGKCVSEIPTYYSGLLENLIVKQKTLPSGSKAVCQYEIVQANFNPADHTRTNEQVVQDAIDLATMTTRGLEFLLGNAAQNRDCLFVIDYWKEKIPALIEKRKKIVSEYNLQFNSIEKNFRLLELAQLNDHQTMLQTLCGSEVASAHKVAGRRATGMDYLCYMKKKNEAYMLYEAKMNEWNTEFEGILNTFNENMKTWDGDNRTWVIGDQNRHWDNRVCRDYYIELVIEKLAHKKIKRRFEEAYKVKSGSAGAAAHQSTEVKRYLETIASGFSQSFNKSKYFLHDPLQPGGVAAQNGFKNYGVSISSFITNKGRRRISGSDLITMKDRFSKVAKTHLEKFYPENFSIPASEYILEPEMKGSYESRGCHLNPNEQRCESYRNYMALLGDVGFAQNLTYSYNTDRLYKRYFQHEGSGRRLLMTRALTDFTNLKQYAIAVKELREKQNECIDKYLENLTGSDFADTGADIQGEGNNYFVNTDDELVNIDQGQGPIRPSIAGADPVINRYSLNTSTNTNSAQSSGTKSQSTNKAMAASIADASKDALAARVKSMRDANAKAEKENASYVKSAESKIGAMRSSTAASGSLASSASQGSGASSSSQNNLNQVSQNLAKDLENKNDPKEISNKTAQGNGASGSGANFKSFFNSSNSSSDETNSGYNDPTGMSDEEKDMMAKNFERNRGQYNPKEEDSLFQVVSKTYMRNLEKILTRKKKVNEQ